MVGTTGDTNPKGVVAGSLVVATGLLEVVGTSAVEEGTDPEASVVAGIMAAASVMDIDLEAVRRFEEAFVATSRVDRSLVAAVSTEAATASWAVP